MLMRLLSLFAIWLFSGHLFAQMPVSSNTDDLNKQLKPVKWRSIGPFRGGRSNAGTGAVWQRV